MKLICLLLLPLLLAGCGAEETWETVADVPAQPVLAQPREMNVRLPEEAIAPVLEAEEGQIYLGQGYEVMLEVLTGGNLAQTIRHLSGYEKETLTLLETRQEGVTKYEFVWASAGETGDRLGRAVILDDGCYHYCLSVLRDAEDPSQVVWSDVFGSFCLT